MIAVASVKSDFCFKKNYARNIIYIMSMSTSCTEKKTSQRDSFLTHVRLKEKEFDNSVTVVLEIISAANKSVQHPMIMRY